MKIVRLLSIGIVVMFALAVGIAAIDPAYAATPCCGYVGGKYVNLKTGNAVKPPASMKAAAPKTGGTTGGSNPGPSGGSYK